MKSELKCHVNKVFAIITSNFQQKFKCSEYMRHYTTEKWVVEVMDTSD
jgi:hypothetical protein